jgi:hypothetical protein
MPDAPAVPSWSEPRAVSAAIARVSGTGGAGAGQLLVPGGIVIAVLHNTGLLQKPLIIGILIVVGLIALAGMTLLRRRARRSAEAVPWQISLMPEGIVRRGPREEALPWDAVASILLRGFPDAPHVVAGVVLRDGSEWAFGIADHATARAVAGVAVAREITVRSVHLE